MYILKHYFKPEHKTDNSDFTKFCMTIGSVQDLQECPRSLGIINPKPLGNYIIESKV